MYEPIERKCRSALLCYICPFADCLCLKPIFEFRPKPQVDINHAVPSLAHIWDTPLFKFDTMRIVW